MEERGQAAVVRVESFGVGWRKVGSTPVVAGSMSGAAVESMVTPRRVFFGVGARKLGSMACRLRKRGRGLGVKGRQGKGGEKSKGGRSDW